MGEPVSRARIGTDDGRAVHIGGLGKLICVRAGCSIGCACEGKCRRADR